MLDGLLIMPEEKVKGENLHGGDLKDRRTIFQTLLPEETFVDRRIHNIEDIECESDDQITESEYGTLSNENSVIVSEVAR
jgi:hypothetical protein